MQLVVDALLAAIIVINTVRGCKRGLVKTVFGLCAVVVSVILAWLFGGAAGALLRTTPVYEDMLSSAHDSIEEYMVEAVENGTEDALESLNENSFIKTAEGLGVDVENLLDDFTLTSQQDAKQAADELSEKVAEPALKTASNVLGTVTVFVISLILCNILSKVLSEICKLPFLHGINKYGGLALGLVLGIIYAFVLCLVIKCLIPCLPDNPVIYAGMENDTLLYGFLTSINPVYLLLLGKFLM